MNSVAKFRNINPILLASLVAQESSFNPKAVSIARAVGLTQVTPIADHDIRSIDPTLKSYPHSSKLTYLDLKYKIFRGIINEKNDWRLNEEKSLEGGAIYLEWLKGYWTNQKNKEFLSRYLTNIKETDIILASYNSGATRVRNNIIRLKNNWLQSNQLGEAKKYVYNIKSYCNDFKENK
jgi:membrane-bound lytic murein transglycosylase MltF